MTTTDEGFLHRGIVTNEKEVAFVYSILLREIEKKVTCHIDFKIYLQSKFNKGDILTITRQKEYDKSMLIENKEYLDDIHSLLLKAIKDKAVCHIAIRIADKQIAS